MEIKLISAGFWFRKRLLTLIMKTFIFLCCTTIFAITPDNVISQNSKIKIEENKTLSVDEVFDLIMNQTDYRFFYEEGLFANAPKVLVKKGVIRTNKLLQKSLSNANLNIIINKDNEILIKEKSNPVKKQQQQVSGTVTDTDGIPLPGVNVLVKGTNTGDVTDFNGVYSIDDVSNGTTLVFSFIGFVTQEIAVEGRATIDVTLQEDVSALNEVVVTALGIKREKKALGYSVQEVEGEELAQSNDGNILNSLKGKVAGIQINTAATGITGSTSTVLRGYTSLSGNNDALYVVDGIPYNNFSPNQPTNGFASNVGVPERPFDIDRGSGIADLDPNTIESVTDFKRTGRFCTIRF